MFNPFETPKDKEKKALEAAKIARQNADQANIELFNQTILDAQVCLRTPQFQSFKKRYEDLHPKLVHELVYSILPSDPSAALIVISNIRERIRSLDTFLNTVIEPASSEPIKNKPPKKQEPK